MKKLIYLFLLLICTSVHAGQWRNGSGENTILGSSNVSDIDSNSLNKVVDPLDRLLASYREGMSLTYTDGSTITVSAGEVMLSNASGNVRLMVRNASSTTVTFSNIDTGSEQASTTYYIYAVVASASDETATFKISASSTSPSGITYYKKLGSFYNDSSSNITRIVNDNGKQLREKESKTAGSAYQALTDGYVVFFGCAGSVRGQQMTLYSDNASSPSTVVGRYGSGVDQGSGSSMSWFVKAGDYYSTSFSSTDACTATVYFVPYY